MKTLPKYLLALGALTLSGASFSPAMAQRQRSDEERQRARTERRERIENATPEQRAQLREQRRQQWQQRLQNMTPQERAQWEQRTQQRQAQRESSKWDWVRQTLVASGQTDTGLQDAVIAFMQSQERARTPLQEQARKLAQTLITPNVPDAQLSTELAAFRTAVAGDKTRYDAELAALDQRVKFSTTPRLETLLTVLGVVGAEAPTLGGVGALFPESPMAGGGRGMRGEGGPGGEGG